jgi:hypothetical protein
MAERTSSASTPSNRSSTCCPEFKLSAAARSRAAFRVSPAASAAAADLSNSPLPSVHTKATSMPAGILISALCTQVAQGSLQPSTRNVHDPSVSSTTAAVHQSKPSGVVGCIGSSRSAPFGSVSTTEAFTASWPSRNTVARIGMDSPTTAFAGYAPPSMTGDTLCTGMRSMGVPSAGVLMVTLGWAASVVAGFSVEAWMDEDSAEPG